MRSVYLEGNVPVGEITQCLSLIYNCSDMPKQVTEHGISLGGKERAWVDLNDPAVQKGLRCGYFKVINDGKVIQAEKPAVKAKRGRPRK